MAIHWQVKFKSLRADTLYTVSIYDDAYTGSTPLQLKGAADPFVIQEDDDEDLFKPVRTQSGYIRIVDDGVDRNGNNFDWKDMVALTNTSRPVTLTHVENNVTIIDWYGFMQPQTFDGALYENVQERDFPIQCCLSILKGIDVPATNYGVVNFAYLLRYMFNRVWHAITYVDFQGGSDIIEKLTKKVDWQNLIDIEDVNQMEVKYNCMELLENICTFFGWSCRQFRDSIYFVSPDDNLYPSFGSLEYRDLSDIADGQTVQVQTYDWYTRNMGLRSYCSDENQEIILLGTKKAKIEADINKVDNVMDIPYEELKEKIEREYTTANHGSTGMYWLFDGAYPWNTKLFFMNMLSGGGALSPNGPVYTYPPGAGFSLWEFDDSAHKHNYNFKMDMWWRGEPNVSSLLNYIFLIESKYEHNFDNGVIVLEAKTYQQWEQDSAMHTSVGQGTITAKFAVGDNNWWNGTEWQNTETSFTFRVGDEDETGEESGQGQIICNRILDSVYDNYDGYGMPIAGSIGGKILFKVLKVELDEPHFSGRHELWVNDFQIRFVRRKSDNQFSSNSKNEYKAENNSDFYDTREDSVIFASDNNNAFGYGIIMNTDDTYCQKLTYTYSDQTKQEHPEQHFVDRVAAFGNSVKMLPTLDLISENRTNEVNPYSKCLLGGKYYYPMAFTRNWRDDLTRVRLIEIPIWNN